MLKTLAEFFIALLQVPDKRLPQKGENMNIDWFVLIVLIVAFAIVVLGVVKLKGRLSFSHRFHDGSETTLDVESIHDDAVK